MLKHKTFFLIGLLSLVVVSLISCEESLDSGPSADVPAQFTCSSSSGEPTRAYDETWEITDKVGIYMVPSSSNYNLSQALKANYQYQPSVGGASVSLNPVGEAIFYPVDDSTVKFVAYSPYQSAATTGNQATYTFTNQNTKAAKEAVDFIFYKGENNRSKNDAIESMTFTHKFCKINITVAQGANGPSCEDLIMQLTNVPQSATVNLATLALNETNADALGVSAANTTVTAYTSSSSATDATIEAIVAPHKGIGNFTGRTFTFSAGGYTYTLPDDATFEPGKAYTFNFTLTQTAPVLSGTTITDWAGGTIAWDSDGSTLNAPAEVNHYNLATTGNKIIITTNHTATPGLQYSTSAGSITGSIDGFAQTGFAQTRTTTPYEWTLTYDMAANTGNADREGYITVSVGTMKVQIKVKQSHDSEPNTGGSGLLDGEANCFMVTPGEAIVFSLSRPIIQGTAAFDATFTIEKLWDDADGEAVASVGVIGTGTNAHVTLIAGTTPGNALIAAKVGTEIVWSYHIWVTDYNPYAAGATWTNVGSTAKHNVFMDRVLGAKANVMSAEARGMHYQWGRKDPFPSSIPITTIAAPITVGESIKNPIVFACRKTEADLHWTTSTEALWGTGDEKSIYDPCPSGWQVAYVGQNDESMYKNVDITMVGYYATGAGMYWWAFGHISAGGTFLQANIRADVWARSYQGVSWVTGPYNSQGFRDYEHSTYQASGFCVRCVAQN